MSQRTIGNVNRILFNVMILSRLEPETFWCESHAVTPTTTASLFKFNVSLLMDYYINCDFGVNLFKV